MADPHLSKNPISPISQLLKTLGMTREDLVQHTEQMRAHLSQSIPPQTQEPLKSKTSLEQRSRTASLSNLVKTDSPPPPVTPVKAEPVEHSIPSSSRAMDTMQLVMERKSRQAKRERKNSLSHSRDGRRVSVTHNTASSRSGTPTLPPATPHHYRYYSDRVIGEASGSQLTVGSYKESAAPPETPSRSTSRSTSHFQLPEGRPPKTPVSRHIHAHASYSRTSTPGSSPARVVNIVSSPGPMRSEPDVEEEQDDLPYTLPPGPYATAKPDFSYAALIGQAILSSPEHRLTLQDIYEWITTVYPYYTRGEQTWMNSIRHSLSTMAVFRKVTRGRNEGKSLWAIWDQDVPCFANGGFRKTLCADMVKARVPPLKSGPKRKITEDALARDTKKRKKTMKDEAEGSTSMFTAPVLPPFYAPVYPNAQQQPYYQTYVQPAIPADVIFPPLPPTAGYHRALSLATSISRPTTADSSRAVPSVPSSSVPPPSTVPGSVTSRNVTPDAPSNPFLDQAVPSSSSSVPDLVGNCDSSSSPPLSSEASLSSIDGVIDGSGNPAIVDPEDYVDELTAQWLASPSAFEHLEATHHRSSHKKPTTPESTKSSLRSYFYKSGPFAVPDSPTDTRKAAKGKARMRSPSPEQPLRLPPFTTPSRPCTPPRKRASSGSKTLQLSAKDTPLSHRGLHMSPSPSLAYYKSHLDPPPAAVFHPQAPLLTALTMGEDTNLTLPNPSLLRTPSRKRTTQSDGSGSRHYADFSPLFEPVTPKRLFSGQESPFRTPARFYDPHDPGNVLDEELRRMGGEAQLDASPFGLFGKRGLLYDSPGHGSPSRYW
ncbi:hypothetical protein BDW22DRAFT_1394173 [Trametopsis cervina]|nr:hypothetical protein BDW22DRAFT_1394173 [Trametopsis cervina]